MVCVVFFLICTFQLPPQPRLTRKYLGSIRKLLKFRGGRLHLLDELILQVGKHDEAVLRYFLTASVPKFEHCFNF